MTITGTNDLRFARAMLATVMFAILAGCADYPTSLAKFPRANLILRNTFGHVVMAAKFDWPEGALTPGRNFTGTWNALHASNEFPLSFPLDLAAPYQYHAEIASWNMSVDLIFGDVHNNIFLWGREKDGVFTGQWLESSSAFSKVLGTFTLRTGS